MSNVIPEDGYEPSEAQRQRIDNNFVYHAPKNDQAERYEMIRKAGKGLAWVLVRLCPDSRELSLALTQLEDAVMWANSAIARNEK